METPQHPTDDELSALIASGQRHEEVERAEKLKAKVVDEILWKAIEQLTIEPVVGRNPRHHDKDYAILLAEVREMLRVFSDEEDLNEDLESEAIRIAEGTWNKELMILTRIAHYIAEQKFPTNPNIEHSDLKRQLMSHLVAEGVNDNRWMDLIDAVLDGPALDTTKTEDFELVTEKLEWLANIESMPSVQLCNDINTILKIPETVDDIDGSISMERINELLRVSLQIATTTVRMPGEANQPNRHETIHQIARVHSIDTETTERLLQATDSYQRKNDS